MRHRKRGEKEVIPAIEMPRRPQTKQVMKARPPKPVNEGRSVGGVLTQFYGLMPRGWPGDGPKVRRTKKAKFQNPKTHKNR